MNDAFTVTIDDKPVQVPAGATVAAVILQAGAVSRQSTSGEPRQPLCGMGICYECRAQIDDRPHQRTCQIACRPGMRIVTG